VPEVSDSDLVAGLLVGIRIGSGCTSGHGICGIGRFSAQSMVSVGVFIIAGIAMVWITNHLLGRLLRLKFYAVAKISLAWPLDSFLELAWPSVG
jgi:uncharacterized membrane protein YedE/YeeE